MIACGAKSSVSHLLHLVEQIRPIAWQPVSCRPVRRQSARNAGLSYSRILGSNIEDTSPIERATNLFEQVRPKIRSQRRSTANLGALNLSRCVSIRSRFGSRTLSDALLKPKASTTQSITGPAQRPGFLPANRRPESPRVEVSWRPGDRVRWRDLSGVWLLTWIKIGSAKCHTICVHRLRNVLWVLTPQRRADRRTIGRSRGTTESSPENDCALQMPLSSSGDFGVRMQVLEGAAAVLRGFLLLCVGVIAGSAALGRVLAIPFAPGFAVDSGDCCVR